jgi:branched-chain amino acid transport system ATP-binding protein
MLKVTNLSVAIGPVPIIRDASLDLLEGEMCGLIGRNGAGKTTFLRALMGAIPATGKAELGHIDLLTLPAHRRVGHGIVVCVPEAARRAKELGVPLQHELLLYALHGLLHLNGFDDRTAREYHRMHRMEDAILHQLGVGAVFAPDRKGRTEKCP